MANLREKLQGSFSHLRRSIVDCVEGVLDVIAQPLRSIDRLLKRLGPTYVDPSEADHKAQAQELREAAKSVVSASVGVLADSANAIVTTVKTVKFIAALETLGVMLTAGAAYLYDQMKWAPAPTINPPSWLGNILIALFVTGLILLVVKKWVSFLNASRKLGGALKRLVNAIVALGGWWNVRELERAPALLTHMEGA